MSVFARLSKAALVACVLPGGVLAAPEQPQRVVSINLCTDQLMMLVADPDQIASVSFLATEPQSSAMVEQARAYPANYGRAEEVFLMDPDLVLAGMFTTPATVGMLRGLGFRVEQIDAIRTVDGVADGLRRIGALLGQAARAETLASAYEADLAALR
ncbi:MAG: ABC transporter substrate-binding protein, partial [Pseudomonadota bacterium]